MKKNFAFLLSYIGTHYCGWQRQIESAGPSVQKVFEDHLADILKTKIHVQSSGRTDSGVHAMAQVAHARIPEENWKHSAEVLKNALNYRLPVSIRVRAIQEVDGSFHAIASAIKKKYSYLLFFGKSQLPQWSALSWHHTKPMNIHFMKSELQDLLGTHDFSAFRAAKASPGSPIKTIYETKLETRSLPWPLALEDSFFMKLSFTGNGFLKQMVRSLVGTLVKVGLGQKPVGTLKKALLTQDRSILGPTAPPHGLWLEKVYYPQDLFLTQESQSKDYFLEN